MKNISEYNWNWWFILTLLTGVIGVTLQLAPQNKIQLLISNWMLMMFIISILPCLYIGLKKPN